MGGGHVSHVGEIRNTFKIIVRNLEGKKPLGRHSHRWEDNIEMDLKEIGCEGMDWI
jgi:hypothetical protein